MNLSADEKNLSAGELRKYRNHLADLRDSEARRLYGSAEPTDKALARVNLLHGAVQAIDAVLIEERGHVQS